MLDDRDTGGYRETLKGPVVTSRRLDRIASPGVKYQNFPTALRPIRGYRSALNLCSAARVCGAAASSCQPLSDRRSNAAAIRMMIRPRKRNRDQAAAAGVLAVGLTAVAVLLDVGTWVQLDIAGIYGVPLVVAAFARSRRLLWALTATLLVATFGVYALQAPPETFALRDAWFVNRMLDATALLLMAGILHLWTASLDIRALQQHLLREQNRRLEAANQLLVDHEAKIIRQNDELLRAKREVEAASTRKSRVFNAVSHDIRNPANAINLLAEVIARTADDPARASEVAPMTRRLQSNAQALMALVSEVLDTARLESGRLERCDSTFSLDEFVETKCRELGPLAAAKLLRLEAVPARQTVCVRTDRTKLDRIVTNLVTNAIKFTIAGGVTVGATVEEDAAVLRIRDTGIGMAAGELERIFDEFAQLGTSVESTRDADKGWGLGLAISRRLAHFIGASISVDSQLDQGTEFALRLPRDCVVEVRPVEYRGAIASTDPARVPSGQLGSR
jgi:signal transduction histidine kinase